MLLQRVFPLRCRSLRRLRVGNFSGTMQHGGYRSYRGASYYEVNQYGADLLRRAVNYGYREGYRAGVADREDRWNFDYRDSYAYQDANYGYDGYCEDQGAYNYYFREGFRRGYE